MGCCLTTSNNDSKKPLLDDIQLKRDEIEAKSEQPLTKQPSETNTNDGIPEMSVNKMNSLEHRRGNAKQPSALDNFGKQLSTAQALQVKNMSPNNMIIPESSEILDVAGDVHANRFYNQTRNTNLSIASKMTDLSERPIKTSMDSTVTFKTTISQNNSVSSDVVAKESAADITWDDADFSEKHSLYIDDNNHQATV